VTSLSSIESIKMNLEDSIITKSRRGALRYSSNPSVSEAYNDTKKGTRRIGNRYDKNSAFIVSKSGETLASAQFYDVMTVDKTQFIKLYIQGVKALQDLTSAGTKVFELLYYQMQKRPSVDKIYLHYATVQENGGTMSLATFKRGMNELIAKEFIYECVEPLNYFVNINYMFNGDRLAFVKEYRIRTIPEAE
jgi:hypothetical protein